MAQFPPEVALRGSINKKAVHVNRTDNGSGTYRAAVVTTLGKPLEVLPMERGADLEEGMVRIKIRNAGVNFADILICQGKYQDKPPLPFCPGSEFAGTVIEVGPGVTKTRVGDEVFGLSTGGGSCSQERIVSQHEVIPRPPSVSAEVASSVLCVYGTAWMALKRRVNIQPSDVVLVTAAAGGVGLAAVDIAVNLFGAKAIAACGSDEKCEVAKSRGAFAGINYSTEKLSDRVKELTDGKGANIIIDNIGGDIFKECLRSVAFEGRIVVIGFASGEIPKIPANILLVKSCSAVGIWWGNYSLRHPEAFQESIDGAVDGISRGILKPHISKVFALNRVNEAYQYVLSRASTGKVVIDCQALS